MMNSLFVIYYYFYRMFEEGPIDISFSNNKVGRFTYILCKIHCTSKVPTYIQNNKNQNLSFESELF